MILNMKNRIVPNHVFSVAAGLALTASTNAMAQVQNLDPGIPKLGEDAASGGMLIWGIAGVFAVLVLVVAFHNAKRIIGNRDA